MIEQMKAIVKEAGKIMLKAHNIKDKVESKEGRANFVTKYDVEVQDFLFQELRVLYPEAAFIGEEEAGSLTRQSEYCFIIDPIDGTTNFIFDLHQSCISVGLMHHGRMELGVVYNPYLEEMFSAIRGKGAYLNDRRLQLKDFALADGIVSIGTCPYYRDKADETFALSRKLYDRALDLRRSGSAALDLCNVAAGRYVLYFEMKLSPWDYAAGSLILTEAGGRISTMEGEELIFSAPCSAIAATPTAYREFFTL